jgi:hypothetical protein
MPFNTRFYQHMLQARRAEYNKGIQDLWTTNGPDAHSADMVVIAGDFRVRAHSNVLRHRSSYFDTALAAAISGPVGPEINITGVEVSTFWRVLQLVYCNFYTLEPCPLTLTVGKLNIGCVSSVIAFQTESGHDATKHASVYRLAVHWGLRPTLRAVALENFRTALQNDSTTEPWVSAANAILPSSMVQGGVLNGHICICEQPKWSY